MKNTFSFRICQIGMAERGGAEGTAYFLRVFLAFGKRDGRNAQFCGVSDGKFNVYLPF